MGAITGAIDHAALTRLARGEGGGVRLGDFGRPWSLSLSLGYASGRDLPVQLCRLDEVAPYVAYAAGDGRRAAATGLDGAPAVRWAYLGAIKPYGVDPEVGLVDQHMSSRRGAFVPRAEAAGGAVRLAMNEAWVTALFVDGGGAPIAVKVGLLQGRINVERGSETAVPVAGDRADVIAFTDLGGRQAAWMLRVPGAAPTRWITVDFANDEVIGDGAGGGGLDDPGLRVAEATDPWDSPAFVVSAAGSPVLYAGPDLMVEHGAIGLDDLGRMTTLVVIS